MKVSRIVVALGLASCLGVLVNSLIACCHTDGDGTNSALCYEACLGTENFLYSCGYAINDDDIITLCSSSTSSAQSACEQTLAVNPVAMYVECDDDYAGGETGGNDEVGDGDGDPWDPGSYVSFDPRSQIYEIDQAFVDSLIAGNLTQLDNDSARVELGSSGYYQFVTVATGDLAALAGLMTGDTLLSINGYDLAGLDDQFAAFQALQGETTFYVTVGRAVGPVTLHYELVN